MAEGRWRWQATHGNKNQPGLAREAELISQLADRISSLSPDELIQLGPLLQHRPKHPKLQKVSSEGLGAGAHPGSAPKEEEEKKVEKTAFDVKLEKFDATAKIKVIKEVRAFTNLGLKEAEELVEKAPVLLKQGISKEEADGIIEKIRAAGGVAVMEAPFGGTYFHRSSGHDRMNRTLIKSRFMRS
ncbi:hypothetical protein KSP39_PZI014517 [Platanthera zijinensis]|uniref:Large ribosomal subunit protein bL12 C-terminal domain-containing protein n=1 Tax=Platanthera zijinensis TaxID=2320716 RepID=A0AAP0BCV4_9ASPA